MRKDFSSLVLLLFLEAATWSFFKRKSTHNVPLLPINSSIVLLATISLIIYMHRELALSF